MTATDVIGLAAVSHGVDPAQVAALLDVPVDEVVATLFPEVTTQTVDGELRWVLKPGARRRALGSAEVARPWVERAGAPKSPTETILRDWLRGTLADVPQHLHRHPDEMRRVAAWLADTDGVEPVPRAVLAQIAVDDLRRRFEHNASAEFVGRKDALNWLEKHTTGGARIAVIDGLGGAGKSALLAKFLLQTRAFRAGGPIGLAIDFDDPGLSVARPDLLSLELARQAAIQDPALLEHEQALRRHADEVSGSGKARDLMRAGGDEHGRSYSLGDALFTKLGRLARRVVIVLDTLERPRHTTPHLLDQYLGFVVGEVAAQPNLGLVLAGRAPLELSALPDFPRWHLGALDRDHAADLLGNLGLDGDRIHRVLNRLPAVHFTPLNLRLAARAVTAIGAADDAFDRAIRLARVTGFLQRRIIDHLPSPRLAAVMRSALLLGSITPGWLLTIVGGLVEPPIADAAEADALFDAIARVTDLVAQSVPGERRLEVRPEVAADLRSLALEHDPEHVTRVQARAIAVLRDATSPADRAELAYHLAASTPRALNLNADPETQIGEPATGAEANDVRALLSAGRGAAAVELLDRICDRVRDTGVLLDGADAALALGDAALAKRFAARVADVVTTTSLALARASAVRSEAARRLGDPAKAAALRQGARGTLELVPLADGSPIDRARVLVVLARGDRAWARDQLATLFENRWASLAGAGLDLLRAVGGLVASRDSVEWAAKLGAFDGSAPGRPSFEATAAALAGSRRAYLIPSNVGMPATGLVEARRRDQLGPLVVRALDGLADDRPLVRALAIVLEELRGDPDFIAKAAPVATTTVAELNDLAARLTEAFDGRSWTELLHDLHDDRLIRRTLSNDLDLIVRSSLTEIDRAKRGRDLAALLAHRGLHDLAALAASTLGRDDDIEHAPTTMANAHALLIQIAGYPVHALPPVNDAEDLAMVLRDPALCGYPPDQVRVLLDEQATLAGMIAAIEDLVLSAGDDATVFFYFSGNAGHIGDTTYFLPYDTDWNDVAGSALSAARLAGLLTGLKGSVHKVLLIIDCSPGLSETARDVLVKRSGWAVLASSSATEPSDVEAGETNSIFTKHLLAGLRGARPSADGYIGVFGLFEYLQPLVVQEQPRQHPTFHGDLTESFAIARSRGGTIDIVPTTDDGFEFHALVIYAKADAAFVRDKILPPLRAAGLRVATTNDVADLGLDRVVNLEQGLKRARRTIVVVSSAFLNREKTDDKFADLMALQRKHKDIISGTYSLIPAYLEDPDTLSDVPLWLGSLVGVQLGGEADVEGQMKRLVTALTRPLPRR